MEHQLQDGFHLLLMQSLRFFIQTKTPSDVKSVKYATIAPLFGSLGNKLAFNHTSGIGEVKLKDVSTRFNI